MTVKQLKTRLDTYDRLIAELTWHLKEILLDIDELNARRETLKDYRMYRAKSDCRKQRR